MSDESAEADFRATCPRCDEPITGEEGVCPDCGLEFLDEEGGLSSDAVDAMLADVDIEPPTMRAQGGYYTPHWVRLVVALAISAPMAPLVLFMLEAMVPTPFWLGGVVFLFGWLVPGYLLSRRAVPSVVVASGLLLVGTTMAATPFVIRAGRRILGTDPATIGMLGSNVWATQNAFFVLGVIVMGLGWVVYRYATARRESWDEQASEVQR